MALTTSSIGSPWQPVVVESGIDGLIVVRPADPESAPSHLGSAIDICGATLVVDVTAGNAAPTAHIFDVFWSLTWLADVYGDAVVEQVKALVQDPALAPTNVTATFGSLSEVMVRLGHATWLHRWWPSGNPALNVDFSVELLELEIGALRWLAEAAFLETSPIERLLSPHVDTLRSSYDWNRYENVGLGQQVVEEVLTTALRGVVSTLEETVPGYAGCADLLEAIDDGAQLSVDDWRLFADLLDAHHDALVRTRGGNGGESIALVPETGWTSVETAWTTADVRDLPPRFLADVENNVAWDIETSGTDVRVTIVALAAPALHSEPGGGSLMARAFVNGTPIVFELAWVPGERGAVFRGAETLPAGTDPGSMEFEAGVFHPSWAGSARLAGNALEQATLERTEVARVLTDRYMRFPDRLASMEVRWDPSERPTAAEIVARFRDR